MGAFTSFFGIKTDRGLGPGSPGQNAAGLKPAQCSTTYFRAKPSSLQGYKSGPALKRLIIGKIKAAARLSRHRRRWRVPVALSFPLAQHYRAVFGTG